MEIALVIAIYAALVATASVIAQVVTWRASGARVKVTANYGLLVSGPHVSDQQHVIVKATNKGRASVALTSWGFDLGGDRMMVVFKPLPQSTVLPHTLDGGHEASFFMPLDRFKDFLRKHGLRSARAFVQLGNDKRVMAKKSTAPR